METRSLWRRAKLIGAQHFTRTVPPAASDYRPIANVQLLYKVFAYMILHRIEPILESVQPEEQHGFRPNRRLEEHLLTANMIIDNTRQCGMPLWVLSLDLSKAFDRVDWPSLWQALRAHGVSEHIIWILQRLYFEQHGEVVNSAENKSFSNPWFNA